MSARRPIVLLGMLAKLPVPGVVWQTVHYLQGLERLGFEPYYVEANARTPSMLMSSATDDGSARAAELIKRVMDEFGFANRWAYHALHDDGRCYGIGERELHRLYRDAEVVINLHGGTEPRPEFGDRLIYLETDPVQLQIELHDGVESTFEFLEAHSAFFTFAENLGRPGCGLPVCDRFDFVPTRQPVVIDHWTGDHDANDALFTTVSNWRQGWRTVRYQGETYGWSKDDEWRKFLDLPGRSRQPFEVALSGFRPEDREQLEANGWRVRHALDFSTEAGPYRDYIAGSRGEFTVAKDQNIRLRTGWFSDRSATYLAAGRPVITQDTGFDCALPTGAGLFAVKDVDEAAAAVDAVNGDYDRHRRAAAEIAREFFDAERVLGDMLDAVGIGTARRPAAPSHSPAPPRRALGPDSSVLALVPHFKCEEWLDDCLDSLVKQDRPLDGIVVIDDASDDPPLEIVERYPQVTLLHADENSGPYRLVQQVINDTAYDAYMFQDADDWSAPSRLRLLLERAAETGAELIGSQEIRVFCNEPEAAEIEWPLDGNAEFVDKPTAFPLLHPTSLVSRDLQIAAGGFSTGLRFGGDAEFLRRAHHIGRCVNSPAFLYHRRIRQGSLTTAPATALGTPERRRVMELTFARAKRNAELVAAGEAPDLSPIASAPPVSLSRLAGPPLLTEADSRPAPPVAGPPEPTRSAPADGPPRPIFVVGADRSGVSALACALGQHPAIRRASGGAALGALARSLLSTHDRALDEDGSILGLEPPSPEEFCEGFGPAASSVAAGGASRWVDGSWQNAGNELALAALFPEARFIHVVRDVDSAVAAVADPPFGSAAETGGTQIPARLREKIERDEAVERWLTTVEAAVTAREQLGEERVLEVEFADLLSDPEALIRRCLEFAGEPYRPECMRPLRRLTARLDVEQVAADAAARETWRRARDLSRTPRATGRQLWGAGPRLATRASSAAPDARVVMVTDHFPKVSETFFVRKFLGLRRRGWDVHVVCNRSSEEQRRFFPGLEEEVDPSRLHAGGDIEAEILALEPQVVHFGYGTLARGHMHLGELLGCSMVVSFRGYDINHFGVDDPDCYADVWERADCIHAVSRAVWQRAVERGCPPDREHAVIFDAVDTAWFAPKPSDPLASFSKERPLRILSVGRLHWKKGYAYGLDAVRRLLDQGVPVQYRIAGDGEQRDAIEYDIDDHGLADHVELSGACNAGQVRAHMEWADVFLHPAISEAFGVAVLEAQAMGLPVVCSDAGGLPENVIDGESGIVVPARHAGALAVAIGRLAANPGLVRQMADAARRRAETSFDVETQLDRFERLYRSQLASVAASRPAPSGGPASREDALEAMRRDLEAAERNAELLRTQVWRREVVEGVRSFVEGGLPPAATVAVVSRGDESIVDLAGARGVHFPSLEDGTYVGHHPADSEDAIAHLDAIRLRGARYLVIPATSIWWLEYYADFARHLDERYTRVGESAEGFVAYDLGELGAEAPAEALAAGAQRR